MNKLPKSQAQLDLLRSHWLNDTGLCEANWPHTSSMCHIWMYYHGLSAGLSRIMVEFWNLPHGSNKMSTPSGESQPGAFTKKIRDPHLYFEKTKGLNLKMIGLLPPLKVRCYSLTGFFSFMNALLPTIAWMFLWWWRSISCIKEWLKVRSSILKLLLRAHLVIENLMDMYIVVHRTVNIYRLSSHGRRISIVQMSL